MSCNCQPGWDIRCMCEPYMPRDNHFVEFSKCPMAVQNAIWHIENVSFAELPACLQSPSLMTCQEYTDVVRPILEQWFKYSQRREIKVKQVLDALLNDCDLEFKDKVKDKTSDEEFEDSDTAQVIKVFNDDNNTEDMSSEEPEHPPRVVVHHQPKTG